MKKSIKTLLIALLSFSIVFTVATYIKNIMTAYTPGNTITISQQSNEDEEEGPANEEEGAADVSQIPEEEEDEGPVLLSSLHPFKGELILEDYDYASSISDNTGQIGYAGAVYKSSAESLNEVTYLIEDKYKKLSFQAALTESDKSREEPIWLEVWGDGRKIGETTRFKAGEKPAEFSFDISGVEELTIKVNAVTFFDFIGGPNSSSMLLLSEMYLGP